MMSLMSPGDMNSTAPAILRHARRQSQSLGPTYLPRFAEFSEAEDAGARVQYTGAAFRKAHHFERLWVASYLLVSN
jgi:hypothetical protein